MTTSPVISVRPENGRIGEYSEGELNGSISMSTFLGDYINYEIKLDDDPTIEVNEYAEHIEKVRR